ncbi:hypothetical protein [Porcipelethomonas sp.]|uniref:hypothetical protein n=1 Tax=Porcipelethomonas sp. TaxID=2981675 RepID=UPI003EF821D4
MDRKFYTSVIASALICCLVFIFLAFYSVGVIDRSNTRNLLNDRIDQVCEKLDDNIYESKELTEEIYNNYKSKSRVLAIMLSKNKSIMTDETSLEELRMAIGANIISITDSKGIIQFSTNPSSENKKAYEDFFPAIDNKVFSEAVLNTENNHTSVITGCSRLDAPGIVQIEFIPENAEYLLDLTDISKTLTEMPVLKNGHMAIIQASDYKYISHTDYTLVGTKAQFSESDFPEEKGWFSSEHDGHDVLVQYQKHNDNIIIGMVSYDEIYNRRNSIIKWTIFIVPVTAGVITLTFRNKIIHIQNRKEKK